MQSKRVLYICAILGSLLLAQCASSSDNSDSVKDERKSFDITDTIAVPVLNKTGTDVKAKRVDNDDDDVETEEETSTSTIPTEKSDKNVDQQTKNCKEGNGADAGQRIPEVIKNRSPFAPFIKHYYKSMVVVREWYTKTVGATMNGRRKKDEDALVVHAPSNHLPNVRFKALFDGHGGYEVSRACATFFPNHFSQMTSLEPEAFTKASENLDVEVILGDPVKRSKSGSTGIIVAIEKPDPQSPKFLVHVANVGDSRAFILHSNGTYTIMSKDHKPNDIEELTRIKAAGGSVLKVRRIYRLDGTLALSRAFGDVRMKANRSLAQNTQKVVVTPDVRTFEAQEGDYIFVACDGMFEAKGMTWDFVANMLMSELKATGDNTVESAFRMLNAAYLLGSADNISLILTKLLDKERSDYAIKRFSYDYTGRKIFAEANNPESTPTVNHDGEYQFEKGIFVTLF